VGLAGSLVLTLLAAAWLVAWNLERGLSPLARLGAQADAIGSESLATRFPVTGVPAELVPIGHRLNDLLARLDSAFERERRFTAAVTHELRTPIAELRSACDVALRWPEESRASLAEAHEVSIQMGRLVEALLELRRGETGSLSIDLERVDPAELLDGVLR